MLRVFFLGLPVLLRSRFFCACVLLLCFFFWKLMGRGFASFALVVVVALPHPFCTARLATAACVFHRAGWGSIHASTGLGSFRANGYPMKRLRTVLMATVSPGGGLLYTRSPQEQRVRTPRRNQKRACLRLLLMFAAGRWSQNSTRSCFSLPPRHPPRAQHTAPSPAGTGLDVCASGACRAHCCGCTSCPSR